MNVLVVNSSARTGQHSVSRQLVDALVQQLSSHHSDLNVTYRDAAAGIPLVDDAWAGGAYIPAEQRTSEQRQSLAFSDEVVQELIAQDVLILGSPIYNFTVPAAMKAYIDQICRAGLTFKFSENGPEGLLKGKKAYIVVASGGVEIGSPYDMATPYLRQVLGFIGITDVEVLGADRLNILGDSQVSQAREAIQKIQQVA